MPHGHSHSHGDECGHEATDIDHALEMGIQYSLFQKIDLENVECLNEETDGSGKKVFKPYEKRLDFTEFVASDADEELLFNIPFTGNIKLKGIIIIGANDDSHPNKVRLFKNREKMTFSDAEIKADQEFELSRDPTGLIEYSPKVVTFSNVHDLTLHFPSNFGADSTRIYYIAHISKMPHGHSHSHGDECGHEATDIDHALEMGIQYSLFQKIDLENVECLNEETDGSGKKVFKPYEKRLDFTEFVASDADEELLFNIPFTGNIKLKGIIIIGANDDSHPNKVRLFKNREKMTFSDAEIKADQEFELSRDPTGLIEYSPKVVTFSNVHDLTLHFPSNFGADSTRIYYIGLRGEFSEAHFHGVTICSYEAQPNAADHKNELFDSVNKEIQ